jgi:hypothetical protein
MSHYLANLLTGVSALVLGKKLTFLAFEPRTDYVILDGCG